MVSLYNILAVTCEQWTQSILGETYSPIHSTFVEKKYKYY